MTEGTAMKTRALGHSGVQLTTVGLGTWAHGGAGWRFSWGEQDDRASMDTIRAALEAGINWVDTAAAYGLGHSEEVLGRALRKMSVRPFVATKCGMIWDDEGNITHCLRAASVREECDASLRRLGLKTIDLYQIHWPRPDEEVEEGWAAVADLVRAGKVRYAGVSNFSADQLRRAAAIFPVTSLQPPYSMLRRDVEGGLLEYCARRGIGVVCYSPLQKGLLTGKITAEYVAGLHADDHRRGDRMFNEPRLSDILGKVRALEEIAGRLGMPVSNLALAWLLRRPEVTSVIAGARQADHIRQTAPAGDVELSSAVLDEVEGVLSS